MSQVLQHSRVFTFVKGESKGNGSMKPLLGGKGANLCQMARNGVNVPPGLTITTEVCQEFYAVGGRLPDGLMDEVRQGVHLMEKTLGVTFADATNPLLVSVRSGAAVSMPGMMDTVLNLGLNDEIVQGVAKRGGDRFAYDCYRRLLQMFGDVVLEIPHDDFEAELSAMKKARHVTFDVELTASDLKELVQKYKEVYEKHGQSFPLDPWEQMRMGIEAVFHSWNIPRAVKYREINKITGLKGTAVNVQAMVYGNINDKSCTGVLFTRNPANGDNKLYGEFLLNAQGEDVVAGTRTPQPISELAQKMPTVYKQLDETVHTLETHFKDVQDTEFTVQDGVLFMLQTRNGKRTGPAALKIAVDMWREKLITEEEAMMLVEPRHLDQLLHPSFANEKAYQKDVLCRGLPASPGAAMGKIVFTAADAEAWFARGENVMLDPPGGHMIEVPRGALQAGKLAEVAEFFSFGTNDLTQMTFGISRDDAQAKFLSYYVKHGVLEKDPFETLDQEGVGELVRLAVERGRATRPKIELGICGEHGGDPRSIEFFEKVGLKYVSCSPMRVMIARLAAAQAALKLKKSSPVPGA
uniref:Pyruvate, phosphate dikinase n=1 Tax=Phytophthora ramorum TaxID=164328 RepID=H3GH88_PHYRM